MKYTPPIGGAADDPYLDANPGIGQDGSAVPAAAIEAPQREIVAAIAAAGLTPNEAAMTQLLTALRMGGVTFGIVTDADAHTIADENWGKLHVYTGAGGHTWDWTNAAKPGLNFTVVHLGAGNLTLDPAAGQTIDGVASIVLTPGQCVQVYRVSDAAAVVVAARGYGGVSGNVAYLDAVQAFSRAQRYSPAALTDQATIAWNLDTQPLARVTLAGNRTLDAPSNQRDGGSYALIVQQDATGSRSLAWNAAYDFGSEGTPVLPFTANKVSIFTFLSNGAAMRCVGRWSN